MRGNVFLAALFASVFCLNHVHGFATQAFSAYADLLILRASESGTENWAEVITVDGSREVADIQPVNFDWNTGFRVGFGYNRNCGEWGTQIYYTKYRTSGNEQVSSVPNSVFSTFLGNFYVDNPEGAGIKGLAYESASIRWTIDFNVFDWELGRKFQFGNALSLRPFIGLKGGWIHQSVDSNWFNPSAPEPPQPFVPFTIGRENLTNNFWGIGPSCGVDMDWKFYDRANCSLSLVGDFSGALMFGNWTFSDFYSNDAGQEVSIVLPDLRSGASMIRTFMGLRWDKNICGQFCLSTSLGFEMQFWLTQLQYYTLDTGRLGNVLTLQGAVLAFELDF